MTQATMLYRAILFGMFLMSSVVWGAEGVISSVPADSGSYCYLRFPAIRESTLYWVRPVLKDPASGDIVSFYGPCDHDPLGPSEIQRQRLQYRDLRLRQLPEGE
jgi:hypothetical protein